MTTTLTPDGTIDCVGKDLISRRFYYRYLVTKLADELHRMNVYSTSDCSDQVFFEIEARLIDNTTLKIVSIFKNDDYLYGAKGIPDEAIPKLKDLSGFEIISSTTLNSVDQSERRTSDATKYWDRMVAGGKATYDQAVDIYNLI